MIGLPTRRGRPALRGVLLAALLAGAVSPARAQILKSAMPVPDGVVTASAISNDTLYFAGRFRHLGRYVGGAVPVTVATGKFQAGFPRITGPVYAIVPDGLGGFFVGGDFDSVGTLARRNAARLRADLSVAPWNPRPNHPVNALATRGAVAYLGGEFDSVGSVRRSHVAAVDTAGGSPTGFNVGEITNPSYLGSPYVNALVTTDTTLIVGGSFTSIGGFPYPNLDAVDLVTGSLRTILTANAAVDALALRDTTLYVGGQFNQVYLQPRHALAAIGLSSTVVLPWSPEPSDSNFTRVWSIAPLGGAVYVAGGFQHVGGAERAGLAAIDAVTGLARGWNPVPNGLTARLLAAGDRVYAVGAFDTVGSVAREGLAALDTLGGAALSWNANIAGAPTALGIGGGTLLVGGPCVLLNWVKRRGAAALDLSSRMLTGWSPDLPDVQCLALGPGAVYAGGSFVSAAGDSRVGLVAVSRDTGTLLPWNPGTDAPVNAIAVVGSTVYVGGGFLHAGGAVRSYLAALDAGTGAPLAWDPGASGIAYGLLPSGSVVYVGGFFSTIHGASRVGLAAVDATSGVPTSFHPTANLAPTAGFCLAAGRLYTGGYFPDGMDVLDPVTGVTLAAALAPNQVVLTFAQDAATIFAGGYFSTIAGQPRANLAALDPTTAQVTTWQADANSEVATLQRGNSTVVAGGYFTRIAGKGHPYLAVLSAPGVVAVPRDGVPPSSLALAATSPARGAARVSFTLPEAAQVRLALFDIAGRRVRDLLRGEPLSGGAHSLTFDGKGCAPGVYLLRLDAAPGGRAVRKLLLLR